MRSFLAVVLVVALSACGSPDAPWERQFALDAAVRSVWDVAVAVQWYEFENGQWPPSIDQVADLDEALGQIMNEPPEPVPIPGASAFIAIRLEIASDSLLRVHFDLEPFESPSRGEVAIGAEDGPPQIYTSPATAILRSRGVIELPAYRDPILSDTDNVMRMLLAEAIVQTEAGKKYEFRNERQEREFVFLEPQRNASLR